VKCDDKLMQLKKLDETKYMQWESLGERGGDVS
jgi:hypothetical protein